MATMFAKHKVADYSVWKKAYEGFASVQKKGGVTAQAVYRSVDDPNEVTVTHEFSDADQAKAFVESPDLRDAMQKAGVVGQPTIWFAAKD
jgi:quinol monooxygenase YgiN